MYVVQIEKADHNIPGAYQMINQQFVQHNCTDVTYVNREEDLGLEGLRKAKHSYYPEFMAKKYVAVPGGGNTIDTRLQEAADMPEIRALWEVCFS